MDGAKAFSASQTAGVPVVANFAGRELHLVKKALAIAVLAIERQAGPFQSASDQADMKVMLDDLITSDTELAHYARAARIAVTGEPD
jgi:ethanolamine utilization microcompartment shell protein EutL